MNIFSKNILIALAFASTVPTFQAQTTPHDSPETLAWIQRQANRVDTVLYSAVLSQEPVNLVLKLWWAWQEFDAVAQTGVYCQAARIAAEKGRLECNLLGYERDQDMNALLARATEARRQAHKMRIAAEACTFDIASAPEPSPSFTPRDILKTDLEIIQLDLGDARASRDIHIAAQKLEHALRILRDLELLARSIDQCAGVLDAAQNVRMHSQNALASEDWGQITGHIDRAVEQLNQIGQQIPFCH